MSGSTVIRGYPTAPNEVARAQAIRSMAPDGLRALADQLVLEGATVEDARRTLLAAQGGVMLPAGCSVRSAPSVTYRALPAQVRSLDEAAREVDVIVATEAPVPTRGGPEVLLMSGCDLTRYRSNPILLNNHDASTIDNVLGSARSINVEGSRLIARMRFASSERAERAWQLVREGHLRTASIGYLIDPASVRRIGDGATDAVTGTRGPALVIGKWTLTEVSMVCVPADPAAVVVRQRSLAAAKAPTPSPRALTSADLADSIRRAFGG